MDKTIQVEQDVVALRGPRPSVPPPYQIKALFWDKLAAVGGGWLWQQVSDKTSDTRWIAAALAKGTALISTDGSYSQKRAPHVCGKCWALLACKAAQRVITGLFRKFSYDVSSYQGELLGIVAAHTLILHTAQYYHPTPSITTLAFCPIDPLSLPL